MKIFHVLLHDSPESFRWRSRASSGTLTVSGIEKKQCHLRPDKQRSSLSVPHLRRPCTLLSLCQNCLTLSPSDSLDPARTGQSPQCLFFSFRNIFDPLLPPLLSIGSTKCPKKDLCLCGHPRALWLNLPQF